MPDLLAEPLEIPTLDESLFNTQALNVDIGNNDNDPLNWTSQVFSDPLSIEHGRNAPKDQPELYEDDLGIDIYDDPSIEMGRDAQPALSDHGDTMLEGGKLYDDDLGLNLDDELAPPENDETELGPLGNEDAMDLEINDDLGFTTHNSPGPEADGNRESESPLSSARSSEVRDFEDTSMMTEEPSTLVVKQPAKRRKLLRMDEETTIPTSDIKEQLNDRSAILKPMSFLPKDPMLMALMNMQRNGGFVSSIMGDGRGQGWAPELRGILSIEVVRKSGAAKRKRDSGVADMDEEDDNAEKEVPQIEIPDEDEMPFQQDEGVADLSKGDESTMIDLPADDGIVHLEDAGLVAPEDPISPYRDNFDETTAPLVHPSDQGPVSLGTQHAVHLLRDRFGSSSQSSPQSKANVLFQDLLPEATTTRADATKMFFEVLVLATKDAVKVEQAEGKLGGPVRIRAKRGLWGAWAEREAGGEIAEEQNEQIAA